MEENTKDTPETTPPPKVTAKQRVLEAQGRDVPLDLFLYSCLEQERILKAKAGKGALVIHWPVLGEEEGATPTEDLAAMPLAGLLTRMAVWYRDEFPALTARRVLDHEVLSEVVPPVVGFGRDLDRLYRSRTGETLPDFEGSVGNHKFWDDIAQTVEEYFPNYKAYILRYLQWTHAVEKVETFEPGSRPPVGRFAPPPLRTGSDRGGRGGRSGGRDGGGRGGRDGGGRGPRDGGRDNRGPRPPRGPRPDHQEGFREGPRDGEREGRSFDRGPRDRGPREERRDRPPRGDRGPRRGGGGDEETAKLTESALAEVDQAIASLKSNPSLDEVTLKPANSYYRRIQHQKIVDSGYHSFSVGEGPDRAVKVARKEES